jgi:hypothetical protein
MKTKHHLKHEKTTGAAGAKNRTQCDSILDQAIGDIRSRADHVGSVLEGIMQAHPCRPAGNH